MTPEATVRALADLSDLDLRLSAEGAPAGRAARSLEARRAALRKEIPGNFLAAYDALGSAGRRPAVVPLVRDAHCGGCHMRVPPQLLAHVRRRQSVCSCPHCRRLLFASGPENGNGNGHEPGERPAKDGGATKRVSRRPRRPASPRA